MKSGRDLRIANCVVVFVIAIVVIFCVIGSDESESDEGAQSRCHVHNAEGAGDVQFCWEKKKKASRRLNGN